MAICELNANKARKSVMLAGLQVACLAISSWTFREAGHKGRNA